MANRTSFGIDLEQTQGIVLGSLMAFQQSVQDFPGITENDPTKKAILILQKYITSIKNFNSLCDARQEFFRSKQFVNTFTEQLVNLVSVEAPPTYIQFKQELNDESKSSTTQFLDAIFLKSYGPKGAGSWRKGYEKILYSKGTLCTNVQPIVEVPVRDADNPSDDELQAYAVGLDPSIKAVARQNNFPSQLFNYSFSGGAPGFRLQGTCYLCGLPIAAVTRGGSGNTNCEHIMPIVSALQSWDFIYRYEVLEPITQIKRHFISGQVFNQLNPSQRRHIKRLFEISDEFAWAHWCCNMLKLDLDFLHLNNNGKYVPHYYNIKIFLEWLRNNNGMYDCATVLHGLDINRAKASLMIRIKRLCKVLNERNERVNPNSRLNLIKVYGIFLLLQYVTVTSFSKIISLQGQTGLGITAMGGNPFGISKEPTQPMTPPTRRKLPINRTEANEPVTPPTPVSSVNKSRFPRFPLQIKPTQLQQEKKRLQTKVAQATKEAVKREVVSSQNIIQILKTHFYGAIPGIRNIEQIKTTLSSGASNIDASTTLLNNEDDFNTMVRLLLDDATWREMINFITTQSSGQGLDVSAIIGPANIESICLGWFRDMVYDYVNIKLMITIRTAEYTELQPRVATGDANATAAANILGNDIRCLEAMSSDITTLQGMITQAHSQIYLPLVQGLTTSMGTWSPIVDNIDNVDNITFSLEQLVEIGAGFVTVEDVVDQPPIRAQIQELIQQIQAQAPLIQPQLGLYIQNIDQQIPQITYINEAVTANLPFANIESASLDTIAANIPALSAKITELQAHYNTLVSANIQHASAIPPPNQQEIQRVALYGAALVKLKELLLSRNLTLLPQNLTQLLGNIEVLPSNVELIKSTLIEPLVAFQTYMTSGFTDFVSSLIPAITPAAPAPASAAEGGGKLIRKRKTTRRNVVVIKRKKQNKSRNHKTRKHKIRKHKTGKHKTGKHKRL